MKKKGTMARMHKERDEIVEMLEEKEERRTEENKKIRGDKRE
jgi:hypothetical protein